MVCGREEIISFLTSRRSSKLLKKGHVPLGDVVEAVRVATYAANAHNAQPWRFIIVADESVKERLIDEMAGEWRRDLLNDGLEPEKVESIIKHACERSRRASLIVIACLDMSVMDRYPDERRNRYEYIMGVQSLAAAVQNMLLALHAMNLGACWRCSPLFAQDAVRRVLGIPAGIEPQAMVEIGLRGGERTAQRKPLEEVCYLDRWGRSI